MRFLALSALLISASAFACPDLSGKYLTCRSQTGSSSGSSEMVITQKIENRATVYSVSYIDNETHENMVETYRADGKTVVASETDPSTGMTAELATTVSCNSTKSLDIKMKLTLAGEEMALINSSISKSGKTLQMMTRSVSMGQVETETLICE